MTKTPPPAPPKAEPEKRGGVFWPMLFGGVIAGGIGFAVAEYDVLEQAGLRPADTTQSTLTDTLATQEARIKALEEAGPVAAPADDAALQEVQAQVADLATRVEALGNRPAAEAAAPVDTSGFEQELAALKSSVETQRDEIERLLDNALSVEEATAQAAQAATLQSALGRIVSAVTTGQPFEAEIAALQENGIQDIPAALADNAATGVVTGANLQDRFPDVARATLAAARAATPEADGGGIGGFFKQQLGARSVAPRDGDDADAILSRAEAAIRDGRLDEALAEVKALPPEAQDPMSDWLADAQARQDAQDAVQTLTQRLTAN
ncbi:COG4223 family protein [Sulfitobacter sp. M13]